MRRVRQSLDRAELAVCERIIACYCPYVLVRCAQVHERPETGPADRGVCPGHGVPHGTGGGRRSCRSARSWRSSCRVVGPDVLRGARGEDWRDGPDEPLLVGPWMQYMATALNALKRPGREVLILHHLDGLTPEDLARLLEQPVGEVQARLGRAERRLAQWLATPDVRPALARFAAGLDIGWMQEVAGYAMDYLSAQAKSEDK